MTASLTADTQQIPTELGRLHVQVIGNGPPALLWHSMFVDSTSWSRVIPALAEHRTLLIVDGPSSGSSEPLARRSSISECAAIVPGLLSALDVTGPVDWVGNAWGGHVGIQLAVDRPDLVRTLAAIGAPTQRLEAPKRRTVRALKPLYRLIGARCPVTGGLKSALLTDATVADDPETVAIVLDAFAAADRRGMARAMQSFVLDRPDLSVEAKAIAAPVLFVATDDRGEWTPDQAHAMAAEMHDVQVVTISGARALPALERPDAVIDAITAFWSVSDAPRP